ncbi:proteasome assembly chaperone family protein [Candidatus Woesearchaeota archaeon]|nr:proteasome assembly chaperone family protein [Candidatus Woesearchaeota archaeon]
MQVKLSKKPKNCTLIEGFPGFGLVGTIASEFLLEHLKVESIGKIIFDEMPATVAIHEGKLVEPLGIFYNKKYNIMFLHAITASAGMEWKLANMVMELTKQLKIKELICMEGVGSSEDTATSRVFFYTNNSKSKDKLAKIKVEPLKEGIIIGVTGAVLLRMEKIPVSCIFAETHTNLPDSKAAAKISGVLDKYLGLNVDYKPLLVQAEKFEEKLRGILTESQKAQQISEKKKLSYVG